MGVVIKNESQWLPLIYEEMQRLKEQNEELHQKVDFLQSQISPKSLTVSIFEAAEIIGRSVPTLRVWIKEGKLKPISKLSTDGKRSENLMFNRKDVVKLADKIRIGRPRKNS